MDWGGATSGVGLVSGTGTATYILNPTDVRTFFTDPTLIRTLLFSTMRTTTENVGGAGVAAVGIIAWDDINDVVDEPPLPVDNSNLDWIIRQVMPLPQGTPAFYTATFPNSDMLFQSKAMRRLGNTKGLLLAFENTSNAFVQFSVDVRFLLKE